MTPVKDRKDSLKKNVIDGTLSIEKIERLDAQKDSLEKQFDLKQFDFSYPTYYHKNWWGIYGIRDNALTAGLDTIGNLFLFSNLVSDGAGKIQHDSLLLLINDSTWSSGETRTSPLTPELAGGTIEHGYYTNKNAIEILQAIARNPNAVIKAEFWNERKILTIKLSARDKKGIRDCVLLSAVLIKISAERKRLAFPEGK
ncbi:MAG: hypothetical protein ABIQ40_14870 [Bacteroidia bacterium]